jgi:hypothetical protein
MTESKSPAVKRGHSPQHSRCRIDLRRKVAQTLRHGNGGHGSAAPGLFVSQSVDQDPFFQIEKSGKKGHQLLYL